MHIRRLHEEAVSTAQARDMQSVLAQQVCLTPMGYRLVTVAGQDCTFGRDSHLSIQVDFGMPWN